MMGVGARLKFLRSALATRRWSFFKWSWLALGAYDLILSQLVPKSLSDSFPKTYEALTTVSTHISWQAWAITGVAILVLASIEYSFRRVRTVEAIVGVPTAPALLSEQQVSTSKPTIDLTRARIARASIAVMPFVNVSSDHEQEYFADGMADVLINALSKLRWLSVISRNSSFTFKGKPTDHETIRTQLNVRYVVEGTVAKSDGRIRISAALIDTKDGTTLWSNKFDRELADIFVVQDEIVRLIVAAIEPNIRSSEIQRASAKPIDSLDAYDHYLKALANFNSFTREGFTKAIEECDKAIALAPSFASAWAIKADAFGRMVNFAWIERNEGVVKTLEAVDKAIQLDTDDAFALSVGAWAYYTFGSDLNKAVAFAHRALNLQPSSATVIANCAWALIGNDEGEKALNSLMLARELDPLDPRTFLNYLAVAGAHFFAKRFETALEAVDEAVGRAPKSSIVPRNFRAAVLFHLGRLEEAREQAKEVLTLNPSASVATSRAVPHRHPWMKALIVDGLKGAGIPDVPQSTEAKIALKPKFEAPSIAVLPFSNMSGDVEQEYFADGITEDIINALSRFRWLQVIGRASTFTFKGKAADPIAIGNELAAHYVLTGSVRKSGGKIRVAAQLVDTATRAQVWSSHFDGELSDLFKVQDDLTEKVVAAIEPALKSEEIRRSFAKGTTDLAAYDYYLRALAKAHLFTEEALREVETLLRKALELDPTFADAYSWLCFVLSKLVVGGWVKNGRTRSEQGAPAIEAGSRALELDPQNGAALAHTAFAMATFGGSLDYAANLARKALIIQPNSPTSLASCGWTLIYDGDIEAAIDCLLKAHRLNPIDPEGYRTLNGIALGYILKRDFATAETWSRRGVALSPHHPVGLRMLAVILAYQGRLDEARSIGVRLRAEQHHYQFTSAMRHQWMRDLFIEGMRIAGVPEGSSNQEHSAGVALAQQSAQKTEAPSIAVLPFNNMSGDPDQEYFADGITEDIITALARVRQFMVIARNTTFTYKGKAVDVVAIAKELGVRYVLEGSVRKSGEKIRITAQLIDGATGNHIWAERYDRELADIFSVQDEITQMVVGAIGPELSRAEQERARVKPPTSLNSWDLYQRGLWHLYRFNRADLDKAILYLKKSIALDPGFSSAYGALSYVHVTFVYRAMSTQHDTDLNQAEENAKLALAIERDNALAHYALGQVYSVKGEYAKALEEHATATSLNTSFVAAITAYGNNLTFSGKPDEAFVIFDKAERISPIDPMNWNIWFGRAWAYFMLKKFHEAKYWAEKAVQGSNGLIWAHALRLAALGELNMPEEASQAVKELLSINSKFSLTFVRDNAPADDARRTILIEALRKAGVPEDIKDKAADFAQSSQATKSSIAVLPFENLSGNADQDPMGDGMASDIIDNLSRIRSFTVIARNSSFQYKGKSSDLRQIAKELGVQYVVTGTVAKNASRLRVSVQLIDGEASKTLWTEKYDRDFKDFFDIQDELANSVVARLEPQLRRTEYERTKAQAPENLDVWSLYHRGMFILDGAQVAEDYEHARSVFGEVIQRNPDFALAWAGKAVSQFLLSFRGVASKAEFDEALETAKRAVKLDPNDARCHHALAVGYLGIRDFAPAIHEAECSIQLNPSFAEAYHTLATALVHAGRHEDALSYLDKAVELSPRDPGIDRFLARYAMVHLYSDRFEEAIVWAKKSITSRGSWPPRAFLISALGHLGRIDEAKAAIKEFIEFQPQASIDYVRRQIPTASAHAVDILISGLRKAGLKESFNQ